MKRTLSFIIPALNEEKHIAGVISSIHQFSPENSEYEIIVVDNGSTDSTAAVAEREGATVLSMPGATVGALRNAGAMHARYTFLVFLDSDVYLTSQWHKRIGHSLKVLSGDDLTIAGSTCGISTFPGIIEKCWWGQTAGSSKAAYINSGHMIVRKDVFEKLGRFNADLVTGEDSEFCRRSRKETVKIVNDQDLRVIHEGYPKTIAQFFFRERWHGIGDYQSVAIFIRSKPAIISLFQAFFFLTALVGGILSGSWRPLMGYIVFMTVLCISLAYRRIPTVNRCLLVNAFLCFTYFWARTWSIIAVLYRQGGSWRDNNA